MTKPILSIFYVVGGGDEHYTNLERSIKSLEERLGVPYKVVVLEVGERLVSTLGVTVYHISPFEKSQGRKMDFKFWQQKYTIGDYIDTEYGLYLDTDTVLVQDNFAEIMPAIGNKFGVALHFWSPNFWRYGRLAIPLKNAWRFIMLMRKLDVGLSTPFFAGGAFIFKNIEQNRRLLKEVLSLYDYVYPGVSNYFKGITDEVFFSALLWKENKFVSIGGGFNHSCMGDEFMPLRIENNVIYGKNANEAKWRKVTFFHCDPSRRDPSLPYQGKLKELVRRVWFM